MATCATCGVDSEELKKRIDHVDELAKQIERKLTLVEGLLNACKQYAESEKENKK